MTATLDDHSIQPISYSKRNVDKSTSMRMNWTQAAMYKRNVNTKNTFYIFGLLFKREHVQGT